MTKQQTARALVVLAVALAVAVFARQVLRRGAGVEIDGTADGGGLQNAFDGDYGFVAPQLERGDRTRLLRYAREKLEGRDAEPPGDAGEDGRRLAFLSLSRRDRTALVARGEGGSVGEAVASAAAELARRASAEEIEAGVLKLDLAVWRSGVETFDGEGRADLDRSLEGLWLPEPDLLLLPEELLSRRLVTTDGDLHSPRLRGYLAEGGRGAASFEGNPGRSGKPYLRVHFDSLAEGGELPKRLYRGNDLTPSTAPEALLESALLGGDYLLRHQRADGSFGYRYRPKREEYDDGYNLLRHAGSCYSLVELHRATGDPRYLEAARRGLEWLLGEARPPKPEDAGADFLAIVSPGEEAKLGGAALAVLALVEHRRASGETGWGDVTTRLARFMLFQQEPTGYFHSKYFYGPPDPEPFESIYYPGEAILALARLHRVDGRPEWLEASRRGADYLIDVRDAGKSTAELPHDHWLLMGLEELHDLTGGDRYLEHAGRIAEAIVRAQRTVPEPPDWIGTFYQPPRSTPTATRGEALVAMVRLARRNGRDDRPYLEALLRMAAFQRRCQLLPESALYLPRPDRALGGFRRSLTHWEVRIDYVQHNLSALLGLRDVLLES